MKQLSLDTRFRINYNTILLAILFFFMHNCFYLINPSYKIMGILGYYDFLFAYCIFLFLFYLLIYPKGYFRGYFSKVILFIPILILFSSFMAAINYEQSILPGILTQRSWLITMLLYFPLMALIRNGKLNFEQFLSILSGVVFLELVLYFIQYYVGESSMFLNVLYNYRYGTIRLYTDTAYMSILLAFATAKFMNKEKVLANSFYIISILAYIFIVNKGRSISMLLLLTVALIILLNKSRLFYKVGMIIIACFFGFYVFLQTETVQEFIAIIFQNADDGTYNVRLQSQQYYISKLFSTSGAWLFGFGYPNTNNLNSIAATGGNQGYLLADNGIYGFLFCYGLLGGIWYIYSLIVQVKYSAHLFLKNKDSAMVVTVLIGLASIATNVQFFYSYYSFYSVLVFIAIELLLRKYRENNKTI